MKDKEADTVGGVLNILRERFKDIFRSFGTDNNNGLDIALCAIDTETNILQYAGANNPLIIIREGELIEYKATKNPIGFFPIENDFETTEIQLQNNDMIYIYSDGFQDQINNNGTFKSKRFKKLLLEIHSYLTKEQYEILNEIHKKWKGSNPQTDDITVMGIRYKIS